MSSLNKKNEYKIFSDQKTFINGETTSFVKNFTSSLKAGTPEKEVPEKLQKLFPQQSFFYPRNIPGVYVIYFPDYNKVYIGESDNLRKRILRQTRGFNTNASLPLNLYLQKSNFNFIAYSFYQGPNCTKKIRFALEKKLVLQAGKNAINIISNVNDVYNDVIQYPTIKQPSFEKMNPNESWADYGLSFENIIPKRGDSVIYALLNKETKRLYIGETSLFPITKRLRVHRNNIVKVLALKASGITTPTSSNSRMAEDVLQGKSSFVYSAIKNLHKANKVQRLQIEKTVIDQIASTHKEGLYNTINVKTTSIPKKTGTVYRNPFIINGIWYDTKREATIAAGLNSPSTLQTRAASFKYPDIIRVLKPVSKTIPDTPEIKEKLEEYFRRYGRLASNNTVLTVNNSVNGTVPPRKLSPYIFQGKWYDTKKEAAAVAAKQGINFSSFTYRTSSSNYPDVISVKNPVGKTFPTTPEIQKKLALMERYEEAYYKRRPSRRKKS